MNFSKKHVKHLAYKFFAITNRGSYLFWLEYIKENLDEVRSLELVLKKRDKKNLNGGN